MQFATSIESRICNFSALLVTLGIFAHLITAAEASPENGSKKEGGLDTNWAEQGRYKIYRLLVENSEQLGRLKELEVNGLIDFWRSPSAVGVEHEHRAKADVMIDEHGEYVELFHEFLRNFSINAEVLVDDLARFIKTKETGAGPSSLASKSLHQQSGNASFRRDDASQRGSMNMFLQMGDYHSYDEIMEFMRRVQAWLGTDRVQLRTIGRSAEGREIRGIQFGRPFDVSRRVVWLDAGIHAREWTAIHTAVYFIQHIANELRLGSEGSQLSRFLDVVDVLIFPCLNPDGYEFTRSDPTNPSVRFWRKNRSPERCAIDRASQRNRCCKGVDLNRNFDFRFAETGTSFFPCSEIFHGAGAFSEPETKAVRDAVLNSDLQGRLVAFVSMHAYSQLWIYPFSHKRFAYPSDIDELRSVARRAISAIGEKYGTPYLHGTGPEIIYAYAGGSSDWAKQTARIKYTYTIELRPSYWSWNGFILNKAELIPTARETFDGIMTLLETVVKNLSPINSNAVFQHQQAPTTLSPPQNTVHAQPMVTDAPRCEDISPHCQLWLQRNPQLCSTSRVSMQRSCFRSCGYCGGAK